ncbi:MAG: hypothetical protein Q6363_005015 [Candidatus Njordarchaeota archaeon]
MSVSEKIFLYGVALVSQSIILISISDLMLLTLEEFAICMINCLIVSGGIFFVLDSMNQYIRSKIVIKDPLEPLLLSIVIIFPIYIISAYGLMVYILPHLFESINVLHLYVLVSAIPLIILLVIIYILSS